MSRSLKFFCMTFKIHVTLVCWMEANTPCQATCTSLYLPKPCFLVESHMCDGLGTTKRHSRFSTVIRVAMVTRVVGFQCPAGGQMEQ